MTNTERTNNGGTRAPVLLVNPKAGTAKKPGYLQTFLERARTFGKLEIHELSPNENLSTRMDAWLKNGTMLFVVAGGDGTISSVANYLVGTKATLLPIPFGTLNHFCADLGVPNDPLEALTALDPQQSDERVVDVGKVNTRFFINNSSLGLYPHLVKRRETRQHALGKWMAYAFAVFELLMHPVRVRVQLAVEQRGKPFHAGLIFVANNAVEEGFLALGRRPHLDGGFLQLFVLKHGTVWATFRAAVAFLRGETEDCPVLNEHRLKQFDILVKHRKHVRVSCDGETFLLQPPIHYESMPGSLRVRVLRGEPEKATAGSVETAASA